MFSQWQIGDRIQNRWEIRKIHGGPGKSGMGIVYVVYDHEWRTLLAAKTFQTELFDSDPSAVLRFEQEALTWVRLDWHANVAHAHWLHRVHDKPFLFLEYVAGGDLSAWIGTGRLTKDLPQVLRFALQFCDGLSYALSKGVKAHRDIKPQNCLISEDGILKVTDFGLAKAFDRELNQVPETSPNGPDTNESSDGQNDRMRGGSGERAFEAGVLTMGISRTGIAAGTPPYMAPEQFDDAKHVDARADVYSFGVLLFEMVTGHWPFCGRRGSDFERLHKCEPPPRVTSVEPRVGSIIQRCLEKEPSKRFANFQQLQSELAEAYTMVTRQLPTRALTGYALSDEDLVSKAASLLSLGRYKEALGCADRALEYSPRNESAWHNKGCALNALGKAAEALGCFERCLELNPQSGALIGKGSALVQLRRYDEALNCFDRELLRNPHNEYALYNKGNVYNSLDRTDEAVICFDQVLEINPSHVDALDAKGVWLYSHRRFEEGLACFDRVLSLNPGDDKTWIKRHYALRAVGRAEEAESCIQRALQLNPNALVAEGVRLSNTGHFDAAVVFFDRALGLDSRRAITWVSKGLALTHKGLAARSHDLQEARACFDEAIRLDPRDATAWAGKGLTLFVEDSRGHIEEAISCYEHALGINPRMADVWFNKAQALEVSGRCEEALLCFDSAIEFDSEDSLYWHMKGKILLKLGRASDALTCFRAAAKLGNQAATAEVEECRKILAKD